METLDNQTDQSQPETVEDQAAAEQAAIETVEDQAADKFDAMSYIHAGNTKRKTLCGQLLDYISIQVFQIDDPNLNFVNCPRCKDVLQRMAAEE